MSSAASGFFDDLYARNPDPWGFASSPYEHAKYTATLAALGPRRFGRALEVGCSIGVLTQRLATRCDALLAIDVAQAALDQARQRCSDLLQVRFDRLHVPAEWPSGSFDLIVLSEVLYFLSAAEIAQCADLALTAMPPGGTALLVNWLGENDRPVNGDAAAELFIARCAGKTELRLQTGSELYRIDCLVRT
jgi:SAM-dependent methyltransferase